MTGGGEDTNMSHKEAAERAIKHYERVSSEAMSYSSVAMDALQFYKEHGDKDMDGIRGLEEIHEEIKRLKNGIGSVSHLQSVAKSAKVMALEWVLGVRDDL